MSAIRLLLHNSIDYAGLFPPAGLDMKAAVHNYARYRTGEAAWALGRFILPASRFPEFDAAAREHPAGPAGLPWRLSALAGPDLAADLAQVGAFNDRQAASGSPAAIVDTMEVKASSVANIEETMDRIPDHLQVYIEVPIDEDPSELITTLAGRRGRAKVRTGGVTPDAFPSTDKLLRFLQACLRARVPFKATAGLHHPLRAEYRLTYAPGSASGTMFGFLNLFLAAAFLRSGMKPDQAARLLEERSAQTLQASETGISWRNQRLDLEALRAAREEVIHSFGSCSFTEPITELEVLHLLESRVQQA